VHGQYRPHPVLDDRTLDLLGGRQHRQALGAVRLLGDDPHRPYAAPRLTQYGRGHALRGRDRAEDECGVRVAQQCGPPPRVHRSAQHTAGRRLQREARQHGTEGQRVLRPVRRQERRERQPGHRDAAAHGGQFLQQRRYRRPPVAPAQQQRGDDQQGEEQWLALGLGERRRARQGGDAVRDEQRDG
jgi:hypothetical protein